MSWIFKAWVACSLLAALSFDAHAGASGTRNVVLVHGAFADGSSWSRVIPLLQRKGYHVTAVQLPLTSLADDVAATRRVLERQSGDVILVGHSWGGVVVTEAGNAAAVKGIVYVSALVPDSSESAGTMLQRFNAPMEGLKPDEAGLIWLDDAAAFQSVMASDLPLATARAFAAVQKPIAARSFDEVVTRAAWRDKATWYLRTDGDHALPFPVQQKISEQLKGQTVTIKSSHLSLLSHPRQVASLIERAARSAPR